jgi:hypothetical protein
MSLFPFSNVFHHANIAMRPRKEVARERQSTIKITVLSAGKLTLLSTFKRIALGTRKVMENLHASELVRKAIPPTVTRRSTSVLIATKVVQNAKIMALKVMIRSAENALKHTKCFTLPIKVV